ncbi:MAG TPA: aminotransferase class V-fold PLP-dependent enzyme [Vicinamibacterales bacterium]|nr:aminotransferase class V-fold PLP-dependent enzyme [Vicinamibacterales bacterium]
MFGLHSRHRVDASWSAMSRRQWLRRAIGSCAAVGGAAVAARSSLSAVAALAQTPASDADYWKRVRAEFLLDKDWTYLNNGTLGPTPKPVYFTLVERYHDLAQDPGGPNAEQSAAAEDVRRKAAAFVGADADEIALVRNTTEGMSFMLNGLDLQAGDEILTTFHEHSGGLQPCRLKAKRHGVVIKEVKWPAPAEDPGVILNAFNDAMTPRTKVIMASHAMYQTGSSIPLKELAALARARGIITAIDGAHPVGMIKMDMHDLGVDYYASSSHKWLCAPTGAGILYLRRASQELLWPTTVSTGWDDPKRGAARYDRLSQRAHPIVQAIGAAVDFQNAIGRERIEARVRELHGYLRQRIARLPGVRFHTSAHSQLSGGLLAFTLPALKNADVVETLKKRHRIWTRTMEYDLNAVRISTHIYNSETDIDALVAGLEDILKGNVVRAPATGAEADD